MLTSGKCGSKKLLFLCSSAFCYRKQSLSCSRKKEVKLVLVREHLRRCCKHILTHLLLAAGGWAHLPFSAVTADEKVKDAENRDVWFSKLPQVTV